jgi:hypothetical protein
MCTKWIVLFDNEGVDTLIPWSDVQEDIIIKKLSGENLNGHQSPVSIISRTIMRAQVNPQRNPEVWSYSTSSDMEVDEMRQLWVDSPQYMADLIRTKGDQLFGAKPGTKKTPVIV